MRTEKMLAALLAGLMIPLEKQSKREQRKFHADKRGSWNGIKPTTRTVESRKVYDRNRIRKAERRNACE